MFELFKKTAQATLLGFGLITCFTMTFLVAADYLKPAEYYFNASIRVPDHKTGDTVLVEYVRTINETITMEWHAETRPYPEQLKARQFCKGTGSSLYQRGETKQILLTLAEYHNKKKCVLPKGTFKTYTCWKHRPFLFDKRLCIKSPAFTVD